MIWAAVVLLAVELIGLTNTRSQVEWQPRPDEFVGANVCAACHPTIFRWQRNSAHARSLFRPLEHPLYGRLNGLSHRDPVTEVFYHFFAVEERFAVTGVGYDSNLSLQIDWAFGAGKQGVTFVSQLDEDNFLEHRLSFYPKIGKLDLTSGHQEDRPRSLPRSMGRANSKDDIALCFSCHADHIARKEGNLLTSQVPMGISCERCHGPGADHLKAISSGSSDLQIRQPGKLPPLEAVRFCGTCHRNEEAIRDLGLHPDDAIVTRFQPVGLIRSRCFQQSGGLGCTFCHNPHTDAVSEEEFYVTKCQSCHRASAAQCPVEKNSGCVSCHMKRGEPIPNLIFTDHRIRVY